MLKKEPHEIEYIPGNGETYVITVCYIAEWPLDKEGLCAFCHGDPLGENKTDEETDIKKYYKKSPWAETCPMCKGRPS